ncbi:U32 family peptidase [Actinoallomurus acaciae]|uniref:U32 family peptidase n=1 Tax=Actinoallomurus acaciae TaxID=502577 RepID=A0ABV5YMH2_9ACTN
MTERSEGAGNAVTSPGDPMGATRRYLSLLGLPERDPGAPPESDRRFPDGGQYRVEIPSVEGPRALRAVVEAAREHGVRVHRISQGSGIMLQTDAEIREMIALGAEHDIEICLFVGPRASWDVGVQVTASSGAVASGSLRGADQLVYGIEDVVRAVGLGLRSVLVADVGQLWVLGRMKSTGDLPPDLILKSSVSLPAANPATARLLEDLGVTTVNLPVDLTLAQVAAIRAAVDVPLDLYVEGADDFGGTVRYYEVPEIVRVAAPVHLKFTVRNAPGIYPSGRHLEPVAVATAQERVRRAAIGVAMLRRYRPDAVESTSSRLLSADP